MFAHGADQLLSGGVGWFFIAGKQRDINWQHLLAVLRSRNLWHFAWLGEGALGNVFQVLFAILLSEQRVALLFDIVAAPIHATNRVVIVDVARASRVINAVVVRV